MKKVLLTLMIVAAITLVVAIPASATPPTYVSGPIQGLGFVGGPPTFTEKGNRCFIEGDFGYNWMGDISGSSVAHAKIVSHGPCFREDGSPYPKGSFKETLNFRGTFDGTVLGTSGTFDFVEHLNFTPVEGGPPDAPYFVCTGRFTILSATGDLAGLHGVLMAEGGRNAAGASFGYEGKVHPDPD